MKKVILIALLVIAFCCVTASYAQNGTINGHEYVDLGLSVKWATCNIGAEEPSDYGDYFAWGEIEPKFGYATKSCVIYGKAIRSIAGNPTYDVARASWGDAWRMPTKEEIDELIECKRERATQGGHDGYKITGPNGNSIFLPAAGYYSMVIFESGIAGFYWSATPYNDDTTKAYSLYFSNSFFSKTFENWDYDRKFGMSVRPILDQQCQMNSEPQISRPTGSINGHDYVDLGLSVKWATCNVGAEEPSDYGGYYGWGVKTKKSSYRLSKSKTYGKYIGNIEGDPKYDVARASRGGTWRLPTKEEIDELEKECKCEWMTQNGHGGFLVTGPNGNSIFFPAAGYHIGFPSNVEFRGHYWSATQDEDNTISAYDLHFNCSSFYIMCGTSHCNVRQSVRPVTE